MVEEMEGFVGDVQVMPFIRHIWGYVFVGYTYYEITHVS